MTRTWLFVFALVFSGLSVLHTARADNVIDADHPPAHVSAYAPDEQEFRRLIFRLGEYYKTEIPDTANIYLIDFMQLEIMMHSLEFDAVLLDVIMTDQELTVPGDPEPKSARFFKKFIVVHRPDWISLGLPDRVHLLLHEYLGHSGITELHYEYSTELIRQLRNPRTIILSTPEGMTTQIVEASPAARVAKLGALQNFYKFLEVFGGKGFSYRGGGVTLGFDQKQEVAQINLQSEIVDGTCRRIDLDHADSLDLFRRFSVKNRSDSNKMSVWSARVTALDGRAVIDCFGLDRDNLRCSIWLGSPEGRKAECLW